MTKVEVNLDNTEINKLADIKEKYQFGSFADVIERMCYYIKTIEEKTNIFALDI